MFVLLDLGELIMCVCKIIQNYKHICIHMCTYICMCVSVLWCVSMCVSERERERERDSVWRLG